MRFSVAMSIGCLVMMFTLQSVIANEPNGQTDALKKEILELKDVVAKLSRRIEYLEQEVAAKAPNAADEPRLVANAYRRPDLADLESMARYIPKKIAPKHWASEGGPGRVAALPNELVLVVSASPKVHEEIRLWMKTVHDARAVLADLDEAKP